MSVKPILFNTDMVRAILDGRKTVTRRVIKPQPDGGHEFFGINCMDSAEFVLGNHCCEVDLPYLPGDVLWVRETCDNVPASPDGNFQIGGRWYYKADGDLRPENWRGNWTPSIHMPKDAARIFLRVKDVRVERLQEITEDEVFQEGAAPLVDCDHKYTDYYSDGAPEPCWIADPCGYCPEYSSYPELFGELVWDETIKHADIPRYGWVANPWVWVIEFERCEKPEGWCK